ncbi:MAG: signal peptide peptidase SppA [Candidatus Micrarchaeota archaeon]|nr:signal peptide peptidase SppA [Candidatus Micrarchaeota archaeon]
MAGKANEPNYLAAVVGGIFLLAVLVLAAYSFFPSEGCIGVVEISGPLVTQDIPSSLFTDEQKGSQTIADELGEAGGRQDVRAVLLLIDSPGGSVIASQEIYSAVRAMNKTSVAFIREMAASGGYYAAAGTDYIVANPDALTGSIGARATLSDYSGLMEKLGINSTTFKTGDLKDMGSSERPISEKERAVWQSIVNESFQSFLTAVKEGRAGKLDRAGFEEVLDARILTGRQAKKIGLVDELGSKDAAIAAAARLSSMPLAPGGEPRLCEISSSQKRGTLFGSLSAQALQLLLQGAGGFHVSYR